MNISSLQQTVRLGTHIVPGIWRYMLPEDVLYFRVDPEKGSSCFDCPQVKEQGFHPSVRCCAFLPRIPNFLLGLALLDPATEGKVGDFVRNGFVIPEGSQVAPQQMRLSLEQVSEYPVQPKVICNFLDQASKQCGLYAYRNGVCSTFFCKHDYGADSILFWESLQDLVAQIETALSQWALQEVGFDLDAYFNRFDSLAPHLAACNQPGGPAWSEWARRTLFQEYFGREIELFKACAQVVFEQRDHLFEIASGFKLRQTEGYDAALRTLELQYHKASLVAESLPEGVPVTIDSIWYGVQLNYRNLQLAKHKAGGHAADSGPS